MADRVPLASERLGPHERRRSALAVWWSPLNPLSSPDGQAPRMTAVPPAWAVVVVGAGVIPLACPKGCQTIARADLFDARAPARHGRAQATGMTPRHLPCEVTPARSSGTKPAQGSPEGCVSRCQTLAAQAQLRVPKFPTSMDSGQQMIYGPSATGDVPRRRPDTRRREPWRRSHVVRNGAAANSCLPKLATHRAGAAPPRCGTQLPLAGRVELS